MNIVYLSPHFPHHYHQFCQNLKQMGANVLGIGDAAYDALDPAVRRGPDRVLPAGGHARLRRTGPGLRLLTPTGTGKSTVSNPSTNTGWPPKRASAMISTLPVCVGAKSM
jgi:hypothetical protein